MTAALVEGGEDALHLGRTIARGGQPRALAVAGLKVGRRVPGAEVRESGPPGLEAADRFQRVSWPFRTTRMIGRPVRGPMIHAVRWLTYTGDEGTLIPAGSGLLRQVGGIFGSAARLNMRPEGSRVAAGSRLVPLGPITPIRLIRMAMQLTHAISMTARQARFDHGNNFVSYLLLLIRGRMGPPGQVQLPDDQELHARPAYPAEPGAALARSTSNSAATSSRSLSAPKKPLYGLIPNADCCTVAVPR